LTEVDQCKLRLSWPDRHSNFLSRVYPSVPHSRLWVMGLNSSSCSKECAALNIMKKIYKQHSTRLKSLERISAGQISSVPYRQSSICQSLVKIKRHTSFYLQMVLLATRTKSLSLFKRMLLWYLECILLESVVVQMNIWSNDARLPASAITTSFTKRKKLKKKLSCHWLRPT